MGGMWMSKQMRSLIGQRGNLGQATLVQIYDFL